MKQPEQDTLWDVAVIGGGPAGMMAAGAAAERGASVILLEKNASLGRKLLITGGGRCNVLNAQLDTRALLDKYKENGKFLFSAFSQWGVRQTLDFFHAHGMETKEEAELRVFPASNSAQSVWDVLVENMKTHAVTVRSRVAITGLAAQDGRIYAAKENNGRMIRARSFIVATGGKSRPETGSTGDGFLWLKELGHTVRDADAALVPVVIKDPWVPRLAGVSLQNIKLTVLQNNAKQDTRRGKILFTHVGVSGPTVLNMSRDIGELLKYGEVVLELDALPSQSYDALNSTLQELFKKEHAKKIKNALAQLVPAGLAAVVLDLCSIDKETACNSIKRDQRIALMKMLKHIPLHAKGLLDKKAVVTSGGVSLDEVDFKTMRSRLFPNLFIVGDMLDIDRPSGGYSLQLCWTTGHVAGEAAADMLQKADITDEARNPSSKDTD